jgi:23S rRNA (guanine745-N1)-methyltransferase
LLCTVRGCHLPLTASERRWICERGHSYDTARSGYVNLLQPQDKRSREPGDSADLLAARRRLFERGLEAPFVAAISRMLSEGPVLDVGCGEALYAASFPDPFYGIDISATAIDHAARHHPQGHFMVANADRFLPYADRSFASLTSITGRTHPAEFRRVLRDAGKLVVVIPGPDDLVELRKVERDRADRTLAMFDAEFVLMRRERLSERITLDRSGLRDLATSTYRPKRMPDADEMDVTLSRDVFLFEPRPSA